MKRGGSAHDGQGRLRHFPKETRHSSQETGPLLERPLIFPPLPPPCAAKKKGKKKGLTLTPEQTEALARVTGCLKFLTMVSTAGVLHWTTLVSSDMQNFWASQITIKSAMKKQSLQFPFKLEGGVLILKK